jgi:hypothetical protein
LCSTKRRFKTFSPLSKSSWKLTFRGLLRSKSWPIIDHLWPKISQNWKVLSKKLETKVPSSWESAKDEEPRDYSKGFREIKRQPLKQKPINFNDSNLLKPSEAESLEDICLKKYLEPKRKTEEFQQPRQVRQSHNRPPKDSLSPSPAKGALRSFNDRTDSKDFNKENRLDMSKMTSKEIFDLSQNSMNDLLHSDLGRDSIATSQERRF